MAREFKKILKCDVETGKVLKVYTSRKELEEDDYSHNTIKVELCKQGGQALYKGFKWEKHESMDCEECGVECFNKQCKLNINNYCITDKKEDKTMEEIQEKEMVVPEKQLKQSEKTEDSEKKESKLKVLNKVVTLEGEYGTYVVTATGVTVQGCDIPTFNNASDVEKYRESMISMINNKADEMLQALSYR